MKNKHTRGTSQPVAETQSVVQQRPTHIDSGEDTRGNVNSRRNQTRTQPEPSPAMAAMSEETAAKVVDLRPAKGARANLFEMRQNELSDAAANKVQQLSEARQRLAEAADLFAEAGDEKNNTGIVGEAMAAASKASLLLYQARVTGNISADDLTGILGDQFGFKTKSDNVTPSKTPDGRGEAIRKRIVRAVQGHEYVNGGDGGRFYAGLPTDKIEGVLHSVESGELSFWQAYDNLAAIKRENANKVELAFDPKRIAAIAEKLQEEGAANAFVKNAALADAYTALYTIIRLVGEEAATLIKKAA